MAPSRVTLKVIADRLGVSVTTVSRALNGSARQYRISPDTEAAIRRLAEELSFAPNSVARALRTQKTMTIGLVVPEVANPFFASIAREVVVAARGRGYSVLLADSLEDSDAEIAAIQALRGRDIDGLVLCPVGRSTDHLREFEKGVLPIVLVDRYFRDLRLPFVGSDNYQGARQATAHLIENGHRRIACIQGLVNTAPNDDRVAGYRAALEEHQIPWDKHLVAGSAFDEQSGYIETKLLLQRKRDITAIFALSNLIALGVLRALREEDRKVPDDVSVVCFDDEPYLSHLAPPLSAMAQAQREIGQIATKLLFEWIDAPKHPPTDGIMLPTRFVSRASVRSLVL